MAPRYDSDSSGGEEEDFTETNVLLGFASKDAEGEETISKLGGQPDWIDPETPASATLARCKVCNDLMSLMLQLNAELPNNFPGHERRLYVFGCRKKTCRRKEGTIRAIRGLKIQPGAAAKAAQATTKKEEKPKVENKPPPPPSNLGDTLFGAKPLGSSSSTPVNPFASNAGNASGAPANPFSTGPGVKNLPPAPTIADPKSAFPEPKKTSEEPKESTTTEDKSLSKSFAETLNLNNPQSSSASSAAPVPAPEPWPTNPEHLSKPYATSYLIDAEYETLDSTPPPVSQATQQEAATMEIDSSEAATSSSAKEEKNNFESTMDAAFQRFADRLSQNPEQCIRYEFGGSPLLYSKTDAVGMILSPPSTAVGGVTTTTTTGSSSSSHQHKIPRCGNCGAGRTFEVQMTPYAIEELEADDGFSLEGMDWGTVVVGVCSRDCQVKGLGEEAAGYLEEWAGVQWEELSGGGKR